MSQWLQRVKQRPILVFSVIAAAILLPLLRPGYVLTLDMVFTPNTAVPSAQSAGFPFYGLLWLLNIVMPGDLIQKIILIAIVLLAGLGMYRLMQFLRPAHEQLDWALPAFFAGILYICNPFTYSRFMTGQFMVLLGYALLPWFLTAYLRYLAAPKVRTVLPAVCIALGIAIVSLHTLGIVILCVVVLSVAALWRHRQSMQTLWLYGRSMAVGIGMFLALGSYWIVPFLLGKSHAATLVQSFTSSDQIAFATAGSGLGKIWNILTLQGFWADGQSLYVTARETYGWWNGIAVLMLCLVALGYSVLYRQQRRLALSFAVLAVIVVVFASGTTGSIFAGFNRWITDVLPFFAGYREPQKFVMMLAAIYAICAAFGLTRVWQWIQDKKQPIALHDLAGVSLAAALLFSPLMFWGFHGQLSAQEYPKDWYTIDRQLQAEGGHHRVLFLPWHQYMRFSFAHRIIANPADRFFATDVVVSNNPELKGLNHWTNDRKQAFVEQTILPDGFAGKQSMAHQLRTIGIDYVMLAKEYDYQKYDFVRTQPGLKLVTDTATMQLYKVEN